MKESELSKIAVKEIIDIFGKAYLKDNIHNTCKAQGMTADDTYMLFVGLKGSKDLPDRKANDHGWVVYGKVLLDATTGKIKDKEYVLE